MCLIKKHHHKRTSLKERKVYKILLYDIENKVYKTPFMDEIVDINQIHKPTIKNYLRYLLDLFFSDVLTSGFIHAFTDINHAIYVAKRFKNSTKYIVRLFECQVPKYTPYFIGENQDIAVKKLIYVKKINFIKYGKNK